MSHPVVIVDYDPQWPILYEEEKRLILKTVGHKIVAVEHIGSTAVLGLGAKPIIDMMAGVHQPADADMCLPLLREIGYNDVTPRPDNNKPDWYYCLGRSYQGEVVRLRYYHLHLVKFMSEHWKEHLLFRDFLQVNPRIAKQYYKLKKKLAAKYVSDRKGYTDAKTSFIGSVITQARQRNASIA